MRRKTAASDRSDPQTHDAGNDGHAALLALPITDPYDLSSTYKCNFLGADNKQ